MARKPTRARERERLWLVGNWKMWPDTATRARRAALKFASAAFPRAPHLSLAVAPPYPFLELVRAVLPRRWALAAQDPGDPAPEGEETGRVSFAMLRSAGVRLVIAGHSEVRARGTPDALIARQVAVALGEGCEVVLCVGETERDGPHDRFAFVRKQVLTAVSGVRPDALPLLRVAYEPVWAIGSRARATPEPSDVHEMALWIKKVLAERYGARAALATPVLYGGSVHPENARAFARDGGIHGFLVGRASRDPKEFAAIAEALVSGADDRAALTR
ncbi:MAG: triosephosphate isomerase [Candidatus Parcubacteria bacterium]|nr:MAG: triosephosphate isomerase [Candidatus Parcubacteria bacterium]